MSETRYRFNTYCYCFECGANWQGDLEAHECAEECRCTGCVAFTGQSVNVDSVSSAQGDNVSSPYEYVKALSAAQDGKCSCGRCGK